jgi:hypothetical protein
MTYNATSIRKSNMLTTPRHNLRRLGLVLGAILLALLFVTAADACPNCKEALAANDPEHNGLVKGFFYSILFMMGTPFAFLGCFSLYMYRQVLRDRAKRNAHDDARSVDPS